jgi:hypothetical protein
MNAEQDQKYQNLGALLGLEKKARDAESAEALAYLIVNDIYSLVAYRQAAFWQKGGGRNGRVRALSGVPVPDKNAPYVVWLRKLCAGLEKTSDGARSRPVSAGDVPPALAAEWSEWLPEHGLWLRAGHKNMHRAGAVLFAREEPWSKADIDLLEHIVDAIAHAIGAAENNISWTRKSFAAIRKDWLFVAVLIILGGASMLPVRQSVLAPAEVKAKSPWVVRASLDGVIAAMDVAPNQGIEKGQVLFTLDDTTIRSELANAKKKRLIAEAELTQMSQRALFDPESKARLATLRGQYELEVVNEGYMAGLLERATVRANRDGLLVFSDAADWIGKPVKTGEKIMVIADPRNIELTINLPAGDAIDLETDAEVAFFLSIKPDAPLAAKLRRMSYEAEPDAAGTVSYRLTADFDAGQPPPRIGLKGTAKLFGGEVRLYEFIFRKPLSALRQMSGF